MLYPTKWRLQCAPTLEPLYPPYTATPRTHGFQVRSNRVRLAVIVPAFAMISGARGWIVLGLTRDSGSAWAWSDGTAANYTNWDGRQINEGQNYAQVRNRFSTIGSESFGMWKAFTIGASSGYLICQLPAQ